jgi:uncharacterized protein YggE
MVLKKRLGIAVLLALLPALPALAQGADRAGHPDHPIPPLPPRPEPVPSLTVSGDGEARVSPDEATVRLGVLAQGKTARDAQEQVSRTANAILAAVRKLGVPAEQIQTQDLNLNPMYAQNPQGEQREPQIVGYQANNVVAIRLTKVEQAGPVIDAGLAAGANRLDGVEFGLRDDRAARGEAMTSAVAEARGKAQALAHALDVRLVRILEVAEGGVQVMPQPLFKGRMAMEAMAASDTAVSAGQVGVNASVTVRWEIAPCPAQGTCQ